MHADGIGDSSQLQGSKVSDTFFKEFALISDNFRANFLVGFIALCNGTFEPAR